MEDRKSEIERLRDGGAGKDDYKESLREDDYRRLDLEGKATELDIRKERLNALTQDRKQRKNFAVVIFGMMCLYLAAVLALVYMCGLSAAALSGTVLVTLLGTTTANIIGLFAIVTRYLFHHDAAKLVTGKHE
ncbi:MAG: hypothetical protein LUC86_06755 [Prevotellaceae bacterium]|nr:hypothetical protein [Prevotellaceae bacterium]